MASMGNVDIRELKKFQQELNKIADEAKIQQFCEACAKELAARLLAKVIKRTPVGDYSGAPYTCESGKSHKGNKISGKVGGTLRRGWTGNKRESAKNCVDKLSVKHSGGTYVIEIVNPVEYASYVEFGHRTASHKGWVKGKFMMTMSENEIKKIAPELLQKRLEEFLKGAFNA